MMGYYTRIAQAEFSRLLGIAEAADRRGDKETCDRVLQEARKAEIAYEEANEDDKRRWMS
jgi:uncharacterized protein HemY